jgi:thiamine pyrophosphokinase
LRRYRVKPDVILGDLDSISAATARYYRNTPTLKYSDQESTDLEKAIRFSIQVGIRSADVIGALGGRIDHTTGSLGCFKRFGDEIDLRFHGGGGVLTRIRKKATLGTRKGETISLIPLDRCTGITTTNLKYPLDNDFLEPGVREGISNEATGTSVTISVKHGTLLLLKFDSLRPE